MRYYFAPMEGLTDSIYRRLHNTYFPGVDKYFTPFFSPTVHRKLTPKEARELPPAGALSCCVVPQILTKVPADFLWMAQQCQQLGYQQVDLNLGCPSGTVTAKGKGSGMLLNPDGLDAFLDSVFSHSPIPISVKMRLGFYTREEFPKLLEIISRYPVYELTVHPRVRNDFYKGPVDMASFSLAAETSVAPLCYNGNLVNLEQADHIAAQFPNVQAMMIGRGLIGDPGMVTEGGTNIKTLEQFTENLFDSYAEAFGSVRNAMFRMKEHWRYLSCRFDGSERLYKKLRKTTDLQEFRSITREMFRSLPLTDKLNADW